MTSKLIVLAAATTLLACSKSSPTPTAAPASPPAQVKMEVAAGYNYLLDDSIKNELNFTALDAPPTGAADDLDVSFSRLRQSTRTAADCTRATTEGIAKADEFYGPPYGPLSAGETTKFHEFLSKVLNDADTAAAIGKMHWMRPRPPVNHPDMQTCVFLPSSPSYPSGHSTDSHVLALVLSNIDPLRADLFEARADQIADDRVLAGVHYQSDIDAGRVLSRKVFRELLKNPAFVADLKALSIR